MADLFQQATQDTTKKDLFFFSFPKKNKTLSGKYEDKTAAQINNLRSASEKYAQRIFGQVEMLPLPTHGEMPKFFSEFLGGALGWGMFRNKNSNKKWEDVPPDQRILKVEGLAMCRLRSWAEVEREAGTWREKKTMTRIEERAASRLVGPRRIERGDQQ